MLRFYIHLLVLGPLRGAQAPTRVLCAAQKKQLSFTAAQSAAGVII